MRRIAWALSALALPLGGCGGGSGGGSPPVTVTPTPSPTPTPTPTPTPAPVGTVSYLHIFSIQPGDGAQPGGQLLEASDGNFYGVTAAGGVHTCRPVSPIPCGTIYRITPGGSQQVIHSFGSSPNEGYSPGSPIQGRDGALYGVTGNGGAFGGGGTIYRLTLDGTYTTLHSFGGFDGDGLSPGGLVQGADGNFYGVTGSGGANHCDSIPQAGGNCGTLFRMTPTGVTTILHSFGNGRADGFQPNGPLLLASDGNFYGTTQNGGANACSQTGATNNCGTAFRMTPDGTVTILYSFGASLADGIAPAGGLIEGNDGALYGRTVSGGGGRCGWAFGCGTIFRMTKSGQVSLIHKFAPNSRAEGDGPSSLVLGRDGNFYGTTTSGGAFAADLNGTAFRLTPSGVYTILHSFGPLNEKPSAPTGLIQGRDGAFYGVTAYNGTLGAVGARFGAGAVFKMTVQ